MFHIWDDESMVRFATLTPLCIASVAGFGTPVDYVFLHQILSSVAHPCRRPELSINKARRVRSGEEVGLA
jgi:hypothetical protein